MKLAGVCAAILIHGALVSFADQVQMVNGDHYSGNVISVSDVEVRLQSEINGPMRLPRGKVHAIFFGKTAQSDDAVILPAVPPQPTVLAPTNAPAGTNADEILRKLQSGKVDPKTLEDVQSNLLSTAGPEANAMFADLLKGLMTGKLSSDDIRNQARDTVEQLKSLQKELGEGEDNAMLASYLSILQKFISEGRTNSAAPTPR